MWKRKVDDETYTLMAELLKTHADESLRKTHAGDRTIGNLHTGLWKHWQPMWKHTLTTELAKAYTDDRSCGNIHRQQNLRKHTLRQNMWKHTPTTELVKTEPAANTNSDDKTGKNGPLITKHTKTHGQQHLSEPTPWQQNLWKHTLVTKLVETHYNANRP